MDTAMILGMILVIVGIVLLGVEMMIPGFGIPGISGIIAVVVGIIFMADTLEEGILIALIVLAIVGVMLVLVINLFSRGKLKSPIILEENLNTEKGYISAADLKYLEGKTGTAATDLHPTGRGSFDGIEFDVITEGKFITKGAVIEIYKVEGSNLIVREK